MDDKKRLPLFPLNLQFFADGGADASNEPDNKPEDTQDKPAGNTIVSSTPQIKPGADPDALADKLLKALEKRTERAERSTLRSMAEQYGLTEDELAAIAQKAKAEKARELPEEAKKQIAAVTEKANGLLIAAEVKSVGADMGLLDAETALLLLDRKGVKVDEGGKVEGVQKALEALKEAKPFLFGKAPAAGAWADRQGTGAGGGKTARDEMREQLFGKK